MIRRNVILRVLLVLAVALMLGACQTQVTLEPAPEAIAFAANPSGECAPYTAYWKADNWGEDDWGGDVEASNPPGNGAISLGLGDYPPTFSYSNNSDLDLVRIVVKGGQETDVSNDPGDSGSITWDAPPAISHVTFCFDDGGGDTTTTAEADTTTTAEADTTTTAEADTTTTAEADTTTTAEATTLTEAGITTTTAAGDTTTPGGATTTTPGGATTTTPGGATTTTAEGGPPVTEGGGPEDPTTTVEVGAGSVNPTTTVEVGAGGVTTTPEGEGEGEGTLDPTQETSTTGDEVAGGSDETLPRTGTGQMSISGLAGLLLGAGAILLLLVRRRSRED